MFGKAIRRVRARDLTRDLECEGLSWTHPVFFLSRLELKQTLVGDCFELIGSMEDDFILVRRLDREGTGYIPRSAVI